MAVININVLKENLQKLEELNAVMKNMTMIQRVPVSEACAQLAEYTKTHEDPLLYSAHATKNPYTQGTTKVGLWTRIKKWCIVIRTPSKNKKE